MPEVLASLFPHETGWETDNYGWKIYVLEEGYIFLINPKPIDKRGVDVYICQELALLGKHFIKTHNVKSALMTCNRMRQDHNWKRYINQEYKHQPYQRSA